jgi:hypothetical protein
LVRWSSRSARLALHARSALGHLLDLLHEEPPVRFGRCEVGGAFERGLRGVALPKPTQHCAAGRVQQVIRGWWDNAGLGVGRFGSTLGRLHDHYALGMIG